jgi:arylsulfatase A-like enzyme
MVSARSFAVLLFFIMFGIKIVMFFSESAISLNAWEWLPIWPAMSYQHVILALLCFGVYAGLLFLGGFNRYLSIVMLVTVAAIQMTIPFLHISSFRVEQIIGSYTTFEMTQADSEGSVFNGELFDKANLPFTLSGLMLALGAVTLPIVFKKWMGWLLSFLTVRRAAIIFVTWMVLGLAGVRVISSYIGVADKDPIVFYFTDLFEKKTGLFEEDTSKVTRFSTQQIFGDKKVIPTRSLFSNVDEWRKTKKNVILIVMESMPATQASFMGPIKRGTQSIDTTPNLRGMTNHMLLWKNHYTVHPTSMNSLFSIGCSMYPYPVGDTITTTNPRIPCKSISEVFAKNKYKTALFHSGRFSFWNKSKFYKGRGFKFMFDARNMPGKNIQKFKWGIDEETTADAVSKFIESNKGKSFFVQYLTVFPHAPYDYKAGPWVAYPERGDENKYHNCVRYEDAAIKKVVDTVKRLGLENDTLFIFVSDHGEAFYEHRGNRVHSIFIYEENVHTALGMYNPILFPKSRSTNRVTSHIDILPTVADLLDIPREKPWQGASLMQDSPSPLVYFLANWGSKFGGVRDGQYKAIWNKDTGRLQIFDLKKDRKERRDLSTTLSERVETYRSLIRDWWMYQMKLIPTFGR